jgi:hypothetical protein
LQIEGEARMTEFVLLYRLPPEHENSADDVAAWNAWLTGIGTDLRDVGRPVTDATTVGKAEPRPLRLTGYSIVAATDRQTVEEIAGRCPAVASGGSVEVGTLIGMPVGHGPGSE